MRRVLFAAALAAASFPALAADVGVSITIGDPGFYGRIDIGEAPRPVVVYEKPIIVTRPARVEVQLEPLYLYVPPRHQKNWKRYCRRYEACGRPVYFVQERWYNRVYVPHYRERHRHHDRHDRHDGGRRDGGRYEERRYNDGYDDRRRDGGDRRDRDGRGRD